MLGPHPVSDLASAAMMTIRIPEAIWDEMQAVTDRSHSEARQHRGRSQGRIAAPAERAISQQQYDAIAAVPYQGLGRLMTRRPLPWSDLRNILLLHLCMSHSYTSRGLRFA